MTSFSMNHLIFIKKEHFKNISRTFQEQDTDRNCDNQSLPYIAIRLTKFLNPGPMVLGLYQPKQSFWNHPWFVVIFFKWGLWHYAWLQYSTFNTDFFFLYMHAADKSYPINLSISCVCACVCVFGGERIHDITSVRDEETRV